MEDDIDIYADLSLVENEKEPTVEVIKQDDELLKKYSELEIEVQKLRSENETLQRNLSSLIKTAKAEISRKDNRIAELRKELDNAAFRRGNYKRQPNKKERSQAPPLPSYPPPPLPPDPPVPSEYLEYVCHTHDHPYSEDQSDHQSHNITHENSTKHACSSKKEEFDDEDDTDQKYDPKKIVNTVYAQRLRKKLLQVEAEEQRMKEKERQLREKEQKVKEKERREANEKSRVKEERNIREEDHKGKVNTRQSKEERKSKEEQKIKKKERRIKEEQLAREEERKAGEKERRIKAEQLAREEERKAGEKDRRIKEEQLAREEERKAGEKERRIKEEQLAREEEQRVREKERRLKEEQLVKQEEEKLREKERRIKEEQLKEEKEQKVREKECKLKEEQLNKEEEQKIQEERREKERNLKEKEVEAEEQRKEKERRIREKEHKVKEVERKRKEDEKPKLVEEIRQFCELDDDRKQKTDQEKLFESKVYLENKENERSKSLEHNEPPKDTHANSSVSDEEYASRLLPIVLMNPSKKCNDYPQLNQKVEYEDGEYIEIENLPQDPRKVHKIDKYKIPKYNPDRHHEEDYPYEDQKSSRHYSSRNTSFNSDNKKYQQYESWRHHKNDNYYRGKDSRDRQRSEDRRDKIKDWDRDWYRDKESWDRNKGSPRSRKDMWKDSKRSSDKYDIDYIREYRKTDYYRNRKRKYVSPDRGSMHNSKKSKVKDEFRDRSDEGRRMECEKYQQIASPDNCGDVYQTGDVQDDEMWNNMEMHYAQNVDYFKQIHSKNKEKLTDAQLMALLNSPSGNELESRRNMDRSKSRDREKFSMSGSERNRSQSRSQSRGSSQNKEETKSIDDRRKHRDERKDRLLYKKKKIVDQCNVKDVETEKRQVETEIVSSQMKYGDDKETISIAKRKMLEENVEKQEDMASKLRKYSTKDVHSESCLEMKVIEKSNESEIKKKTIDSTKIYIDSENKHIENNRHFKTDQLTKKPEKKQNEDTKQITEKDIQIVSSSEAKSENKLLDARFDKKVLNDVVNEDIKKLNSKNKIEEKENVFDIKKAIEKCDRNIAQIAKITLELKTNVNIPQIVSEEINKDMKMQFRKSDEMRITKSSVENKSQDNITNKEITPNKLIIENSNIDSFVETKESKTDNNKQQKFKQKTTNVNISSSVSEVDQKKKVQGNQEIKTKQEINDKIHSELNVEAKDKKDVEIKESHSSTKIHQKTTEPKTTANVKIEKTDLSTNSDICNKESRETIHAEVENNSSAKSRNKLEEKMHRLFDLDQTNDSINLGIIPEIKNPNEVIVEDSKDEEMLEEVEEEIITEEFEEVIDLSHSIESLKENFTNNNAKLNSPGLSILELILTKQKNDALEKPTTTTTFPDEFAQNHSPLDNVENPAEQISQPSCNSSVKSEETKDSQSDPPEFNGFRRRKNKIVVSVGKVNPKKECKLKKVKVQTLLDRNFEGKPRSTLEDQIEEKSSDVELLSNEGTTKSRKKESIVTKKVVKNEKGPIVFKRRRPKQLSNSTSCITVVSNDEESKS